MAWSPNKLFASRSKSEKSIDFRVGYAKASIETPLSCGDCRDVLVCQRLVVYGSVALCLPEGVVARLLDASEGLTGAGKQLLREFIDDGVELLACGHPRSISARRCG